MNPKSRAHRILRHIKNYESAESNDCIDIKTSTLGPFLGTYKNEDGSNILFYDRGISWTSLGASYFAAYDEIKDVLLVDEKKSKALQIETKGGNSHLLPVDGHNGRFFDSLEVYRYLKRTLSDIQDFPNEKR